MNGWCATPRVVHQSCENPMIKRVMLVLFLLLILIFLINSCEDQIINITIVIPNEFVPYYDWLLDFPGWPPIPEDSSPSKIRMEYGKSFFDLVKKN